MHAIILCVLVIVLLVMVYRPHVLYLFRERHTMPPATQPAVWYDAPPIPADTHQELGDRVVG